MTCKCPDGKPAWDSFVPYPKDTRYGVYKCSKCGELSELHWSEVLAVDEGYVNEWDKK